MKKCLVLCMALAVFCTACLFLPTASDAQIYEKTLRLHVLANSDSAEDQANKLAVRDAVLALLEQRMQSCDSREQAEQMILDEKEGILSVCRQTLIAEGSDHTVSLRLCTEYYPTKVYGDVALPSGEYLSLQICIGQAKGKNWWCVLYPPICLSAASADQTLYKAGFEKEQVKLVSEDRGVRYTVKFKILETVGRLFSKWFS
ncbi:MAG: stage II sporulation protein R [Ruminococcaceae bacterium]|nr:stage II sporulation protein R [Oscillospiraceae bacterium]